VASRVSVTASTMGRTMRLCSRYGTWGWYHSARNRWRAGGSGPGAPRWERLVLLVLPLALGIDDIVTSGALLSKVFDAIVFS
jgi:hypothetical protein